MITFLVSGLAGGINFLGGLVSLRAPRHQGAVFALGAGILIATGLMALIPEAIAEAIAAGRSESAPMLAALVGFFGFYLLENLPHREPGRAEVLHHDHGHATGLWGAGGVVLHSFVDGIAIAEGFEANLTLGWSLGFGIAVHKFADGISVASMMQGTRQRAGATWTMLTLASLAPLAGALAASLLHISTTARLLLFGWLAGLFLYLGTTSLLPAAHEASNSRAVTLWAILGASFVCAANLLIGHAF